MIKKVAMHLFSIPAVIGALLVVHTGATAHVDTRGPVWEAESANIVTISNKLPRLDTKGNVSH
jgi:hypothetical protein